MNPAAVFLHNDLVPEILSALPVKSLVRFECVSKHWKTLISDHSFVKLHLRRSQTRNQYLVISEECDGRTVAYPISRLLDNPSYTLFDDSHHRLKYSIFERIVGSCNGLILFSDELSDSDLRSYWLSVWNPATRATSESFGHFCDYSGLCFNFAFGCDNSNDTYKVVALCYPQGEFKTEVRVLSLGDNVWRNVKCFMNVFLPPNHVYLSETINWLVIHKQLFVIISFDLRTETYNEMDVPCGFNQVLPKQPEPTLGLLEGCLCFSYFYEEKDFVIWLMKEFGVEDSWTQFLKINNLNFQMGYNYIIPPWEPLFLYDDTLILMCRNEYQAILYNWRNDRVTRTNIIASRTHSYFDWQDAKVYVESLVPISNSWSN